MGYGRFKQKFFPLVGKPVLVANAHRARSSVSQAWVAQLSAIEFLIAEIIAQVSSLRKKMSINFGILVGRATGPQQIKLFGRLAVSSYLGPAQSVFFSPSGTLALRRPSVMR
jgi:hypothetical protein